MKIDRTIFENHVHFLKERYNFKGLLHFTDFKNLTNILGSGYLNSRTYCKQEGIHFVDVADQEVIEHTERDIKNHVRFYYMEKTPTLYSNEGIRLLGTTPHVPIPVYLLFDEELIYFKTSIFSDGNAGSQYSNFGNTADFFIKMDWPKIFQRGAYPREEIPVRTRIRNAELLIPQPVSIDYIKKIIFRCEADKKRACNLLGDNRKFKVNRNMFHNFSFCNYIKDYTLSVNAKHDSKKFKLEWEFDNTYLKFYIHSIRVLDNINNTLYNTSLTFNHENQVNWYFEFETPSNAFKFEYFIDNVLSIEHFIS